MSVMRRWTGTVWEDVTNYGVAVPTAGGVAYGTGTTTAYMTAGTAGQALLSGGAGAPTWGPTPSTGAIPYGASASTMAMLAAGTSGQVLTSGGAGAPTWTDYTKAWTTYTPVLTAVTTNPTLGTSPTQEGYWCRLGNVIFGTARITFGTGSPTAGSGVYQISMPPAAPVQRSQVIGHGYIYDSNVPALWQCSLRMSGANAIMAVTATANTHNVTNAVPFTWAASDQIVLSFMYEPA